MRQRPQTAAETCSRVGRGCDNFGLAPLGLCSFGRGWLGAGGLVRARLVATCAATG